MQLRLIPSLVAVAVCLTLAPAAHAIGDPGDITGTPNAGPIDPPPPPGGGGGTGVTDGCTDSPENPTAVLALLGTTGLGMGLKVRTSLKRRSLVDARAEA